MDILHWTVDVIVQDEEWIAKWRAETDIARWSMFCHLDSEEGEENGRTAVIQLYVRVQSETLDEVARKVREWADLHFGSTWSCVHLIYIYDSERPDTKRAFDEGERPRLRRKRCRNGYGRHT